MSLFWPFEDTSNKKAVMSQGKLCNAACLWLHPMTLWLLFTFTA